MPVNTITGSKRGKAAIAAAILVVSAWGANHFIPKPSIPVTLATNSLIKPWEGLGLTSYLDRIARPPVWTVCYGETKGVKPGQRYTEQQCADMLTARVDRDFYQPMKKCIKDLDKKPYSVQASMISGAYNFGVARWCHSTAARLVSQDKFAAACDAQTAFNKAGGKIVRGLVLRREMGDAQRIGEAELCKSGIK